MGQAYYEAKLALSGNGDQQQEVALASQ
jgi:hypothetical protein